MLGAGVLTLTSVVNCEHYNFFTFPVSSTLRLWLYGVVYLNLAPAVHPYARAVHAQRNVLHPIKTKHPTKRPAGGGMKGCETLVRLPMR